MVVVHAWDEVLKIIMASEMMKHDQHTSSSQISGQANLKTSECRYLERHSSMHSLFCVP